MQVEIFEKLEEFRDIREDWRVVYENDDHTTVFQSWEWLRGWLEVIAGNWLILGIRTSHQSGYVAFLALFRKPKNRGFGRWGGRVLGMAGTPYSDYNGLLCLPEYESRVLKTLAEYLQTKMRWSRFLMREVRDPRLLEVVEFFSSDRYQIKYLNDTPCPWLDLPNEWEQYLEKVLEPKFRKRLKHDILKAEKRGCYVSTAQAEDLDRYIELYITLHGMRWGELDRTAKAFYESVFRSFHETGMLQVDVLWQGDHPIGVQVSLKDPKSKSFHFYSGGWNGDYGNLSPGVVLHGHCIKDAIKKGYRAYDFMRGEESYKYLFGAVNRYNKNVVILRNGFEEKLRRIKARIVRFGSRNGDPEVA